MKIDDALKGVQRIYIETAPLIYYVEENPAYLAKMDAIIAAIENTPIAALSSVITLAEVLVHPLKLGNKKLEQEYQDILQYSSDFRLVAVTTQIAKTSAGLRARYDIRTPDALHLATAIESGCDAFLTNDLSLKRVSEITILILDELDAPPIR